MQKITDTVYYIGTDDTELDLFENQYQTPNGISYNSYVIKDEKIAVMDTVDARCLEPWLQNLGEVLDGAAPDYLIVSHMEPDHTSGIVALAEKYPDLKIVASAKAISMMPQFFNTDLSAHTQPIKDGESLSLGSRSLQFFSAPMVHWPEVMMEYDTAEQLLFSADAFGKFGALAVKDDWACEARRYYFNIVGKYGPQVQKTLKKLSTLSIAKILPLHGPILDKDLPYYIGKYQVWSSYEPEDPGVTIVAASIHGNTLAAAKRLQEKLEAQGVATSFFDLARCDVAEAIEDAFRYDRLVLAAPTYDTFLFPSMQDFLYHLKVKDYQNRKVGLIENGSWAISAGKHMKAQLESLKNITILEPTVTIKSALNDASSAQMDELIAALLA